MSTTRKKKNNSKINNVKEKIKPALIKQANIKFYLSENIKIIKTIFFHSNEQTLKKYKICIHLMKLSKSK